MDVQTQTNSVAEPRTSETTQGEEATAQHQSTLEQSLAFAESRREVASRELLHANALIASCHSALEELKVGLNPPEQGSSQIP